MRRIRPRLTYANAMSTIAVFLALGGGAYAAVSSLPGPDGVIHGCYKKKGGNLRLVAGGRRCPKRETAIAFNQQGRPGSRGLRGLSGARGIPGANGLQGIPGTKGEQGPQGPGATTFTTTLPNESLLTPILRLTNGLTIEGACKGNGVAVVASSTALDSNVEASGTEYSGGALMPVHLNGGVTDVGAGDATNADIDVIARDGIGTKFARIDIHGSSGTPCTFWGMITPSG